MENQWQDYNQPQEYFQWLKLFNKHQQHPDGLDRMKDDLGDYNDRETNIVLISIIALFACIIAILVLWWDPKTIGSEA